MVEVLPGSIEGADRLGQQRLYLRFQPCVIAGEETEAAYENIRRCVTSFKGNLEWTIYLCNESRHQNYYLSPTCLWEQYRKEPRGFHFKERFEKEELERLYAQAVLDIEPLAEHLTQCFERMK